MQLLQARRRSPHTCARASTETVQSTETQEDDEDDEDVDIQIEGLTEDYCDDFRMHIQSCSRADSKVPCQGPSEAEMDTNSLRKGRQVQGKSRSCNVCNCLSVPAVALH